MSTTLTGKAAAGDRSRNQGTGLVTLRTLILAVLFFGAATVVYTFPLALHPGSLILAGVGDHPSEAALIGWTAHQLVHAPRHLFDTAFFYPYSHTEAYWQSVLVPGILAMPVMAVTGDALLATNTVVLVALTASGLVLPSDQGDPKTRRNEIIITELTPWFREAIAAWTTTNLGPFASYRNGYSGTMQRTPAQVRVYGWLFYDDPHSGDGSVGTWRGTAWEIHPVTRIEVFDNGNWREIR